MSSHLYSTPRRSPYLQAVDRVPRGLGRSDLSPFFASPTAFPSFVSDLVDHFSCKDFDSIVALDAVGFVVAGALAAKLSKPLILCRKEGKLPLKEEEIARTEELVDYSKKTKRFEIRKDLLTPGLRVLVVDEWIDTGTQITAVLALLESLTVEVVGIASLYLKPNRPLGEALVAKYDIFIANCLRCKEYECVCKEGAVGELRGRSP